MIPRAKKSVVNDADIMMYLALAVKHLRLMVLLVCLAVMVGFAYYTFARAVYHSTAVVRYELMLHPQDPEKVFNTASDRSDPASDRSARYWICKDLTSPHMLRRAAKKLGLDISEGELSRKYIKKIVATMNSERNLVIELWPYSYDLAKRLPETLVREYLLYREERRLAFIRSAFQTFTDDMAELHQKVDENFNRQFDFRETNGMTKLIIDLNQYKEIPRAIQTIKYQLTLMDHTREALQSASRDTAAKLSLLATLEKDIQGTENMASQIIPQVSVGDLIPKADTASGVVVLPSMIVSTLKQRWEELEKERSRLRQSAQDLGRTFLPHHPKLLAVQKQLDAVNKSLELELAVAQNRFDLEYAALVDKVTELERKLPAYDEVMRRYQKSLKDYSHLDGNQTAWTKLYDQMYRRLSSLDFGDDKVRVQLQFLSLEQLDQNPVSPNLLKVAIYSLLVGLALAIAIPFLLEYVDSRVSDVDQVEESLHIRGLGVVPKVTELPVDELLLPDAKPDHHVTENFRLIRTNLVMNAATPALPQVILVTSAMPQEGKSVVASHLAMSFARKGEKTLLIDADLRRGRLHRIFGCPNRPGLGEVLTGQHPLEAAFRPINGNGNGNGHSNGHEHDADHPNGNGNLTVLTCGKHMHWASELLDSHVFPKLIDELRQKFQRIIIDTPPVLGLSETSIIQRSADGVVLVIWSENTAMRNVKTAIQMLQTNGAKFSGFVLNRLDFTVLTNRYRYFYYSPYYYRSYKTLTAPANPADQ